MNLNFEDSPNTNWDPNLTMSVQVARALNNNRPASEVLALLRSFGIPWANDIDELLMSAYICYRNRKLDSWLKQLSSVNHIADLFNVDSSNLKKLIRNMSKL